MRAYRELLALPAAPWAVCGSVLSRVAKHLIGISLLLWVSERYGVGLGGAVAGAYTFGVACFAPRMGRWLERWGPRWVLILASMASSLVLLLVMLVPSSWLIPVAILAGLLEAPYFVAVRTWWWRNCPDDELRKTSSAWEAIMNSVSYALTPALVAAPIIALWGAGSSLVLGIVISSLAPLVFLMPTLFAGWARDSSLVAWEAPTRALWREGKLFRLFAVFSLSTACVGAIGPLCVSIALGYKDPALAALLVATTAPGAIIGGLWYGAYGRQYNTYTLLLLSFVGTGLSMFMASLVSSILALFALSLFLLGMARSVAGPIINYLVAQAVPRHRLAEASGISTSSICLGLAIGSTTGGLVISTAGSMAGILLIALFTLVGLLIALPLRKNFHANAR